MERKNFTLNEATIKNINQAFDKGYLNSKELTMMYLERIACHDRGENGINSVLEINPDALHIAEAMDRERELSGVRGPMHGIPVLIKDNINTSDKMHTSAGSLSLSISFAPYDAYIVKKLREAGAVILGKANMTEFANFMTDNMPSGYSSRGGQVVNPYGKEFTPGGSSSGSGAAAACNFCTVSIGTETSGSILNPACQNSIVGIKPTVGLLSRYGIIPISHSQDTAGPMARCVEDAAILLGALTGIDSADAATFMSKGKAYKDYTRFLNINGLKGARIGVPRDYYFDELNDEEKSIVNEVIDIMRTMGAEVIDPVSIKTAKEFETYNTLIFEFKSDLNYYLSTLDMSSPVHSLKEIIDFNNESHDKMLKYGQTILVQSENTSGTLTEQVYINDRLRDIKMAQSEGIDAVMDEHKLDALMFPGAWGADIAARAGYPSIAVPAGCSNSGEPFGVTFTSRAFHEGDLITIGYSFEQASKKRKLLPW